MCHLRRGAFLMLVEEAVQLLGHIIQINLPISQCECFTTPALQGRVIAELLQDHEMAHGSRYLALLAFVLWCRAAQLAQVTVSDDGMCAHGSSLFTFVIIRIFLLTFRALIDNKTNKKAHQSED